MFNSIHQPCNSEPADAEDKKADETCRFATREFQNCVVKLLGIFRVKMLG